MKVKSHIEAEIMTFFGMFLLTISLEVSAKRVQTLGKDIIQQ